MRKLTLFIFIIIAKSAFAQKDTIGLNIPFKNGVVVYERVFDAPGKTKMELFNKTQLWFVAHYRGLNAIQLQNDSAGTIIGDGLEVITINDKVLWQDNIATYNAHITLQIDCKDGKYRCRISSIVIRNRSTALATAEDLMNYLIRTNKNTVIFNKNETRGIFKSLNGVVNNVMLSLNQSINSSDNF